MQVRHNAEKNLAMDQSSLDLKWRCRLANKLQLQLVRRSGTGRAVMSRKTPVADEDL